MSIFVRLAKVRTAQTQLALAQRQLGTPAASLLARGRRYPLTTVGAAAGAGFVIGSLDVHPLRVPGVAPLLGGGLAEAVAIGTRLITELGAAGLGDALHRADPPGRYDADVAADASASA